MDVFIPFQPRWTPCSILNATREVTFKQLLAAIPSRAVPYQAKLRAKSQSFCFDLLLLSFRFFVCWLISVIYYLDPGRKSPLSQKVSAVNQDLIILYSSYYSERTTSKQKDPNCFSTRCANPGRTTCRGHQQLAVPEQASDLLCCSFSHEAPW